MLFDCANQEKEKGVSFEVQKTPCPKIDQSEHSKMQLEKESW
jgi:hypothetical protein